MTEVASALAFLKALFHGVDGDIYLCSLPNTHGARPGEQALRTRSMKAAQAFIERWDKPGRGLFFCIGTLKPDAEKTKRGSYRQKSNILRLPVLPIDIDFDKLPTLYANPQVIAIGMLERSAVPPQLTVLSGGGVHAYWILEEPLEPERFADAEWLLRGLIKRFGSDPAVCDVSRLMRLPGSSNSKRGDDRPVLIAKNASDGRVSWQEMLNLINEPPAVWPAPGHGTTGTSVPHVPVSRSLNEFEAYGADAWNAPVDVGSRLAAMRYQGAGSSGVHVTQLATTASLLNSGMSIDDTTRLVLDATYKIAPANWDMQIEEELIRGMCATWVEKHPPENPPEITEVPKTPPKTPNGHDDAANVVHFPGPAGALGSAATPTQDKPPPRLSSFLASSLAGQPVPDRFFLVEPLIPTRDVTLLYGDGGTGKSLLVLQLSVSMQNRQNMLWLGLTVAGGPCLLYTAEEEKDELHRRLDVIAKHDAIALEELTDLHVVSLAGEDATLVVPTPNQQLAITPRFKALEAEIEALAPALVVIDTAADVFGGNENDRRQVGQFVRLLRGLALRHDTTILLCAQPSLAGLNSGSGTSGSTAWNNSARSRLYLERVLDQNREEVNVDIRMLRNMKANYAKKGFELQLQWQDGVFVPLLAPGESGLDRVAAHDFADHVFLTMLTAYTRENREVSPKPSNVYAPTLFANDQRAQGVTKRRLADAMNRLLQERKISIVTEGPPSRQRQRLVTTP